MRIVVLDGYTLNPGDLSWDALAALGDLTVHPRTPKADTVAVCDGAEVVLTNKAPIQRADFEALPDLRYVSVLATGTNIVDLVAGREHGVTVSNVPGYSTASVAQVTFGLLLELTHQIGEHSTQVHSGRWAAGPDFSFTVGTLVELAGLKLGVIGAGAIGRAVMKIGAAFGMEVLTLDRPSTAGLEGVRRVDMETIFAESDVLSLHCPLTPETQGLVSKERLGKIKSSAFLINTARGPLIDEQALADALNAGTIAGAGLDVLSVEPPPATNPLLTAKNCVIAPHIAWASKAARERLMAETVENVRAYIAGNPRNVVNR